MKGRDSFLFDSRTGKRILLAKEGMSRLEFSPDGQQIAYISENRACFEPINDHAARKVVNPGSENDALWAFFDEMGNPNALILRCDGQSFGHAIELVDARTLKVRWRLEKVCRYLEPFAFSPKVFAVRFMDDLNINLCSMTDGKKLRSGVQAHCHQNMCPAKSSNFRLMDASFSISTFIVKGSFPGCYPLKRMLSMVARLVNGNGMDQFRHLVETESWKLVALRSDVSETVLFLDWNAIPSSWHQTNSRLQPGWHMSDHRPRRRPLRLGPPAQDALVHALGVGGRWRPVSCSAGWSGCGRLRRFANAGDQWLTWAEF